MVVDVHVRDTGSGLPLVLLHAFPLSSAMWGGLRGTLGGRVRVITPDQRGFGGSALGADEPSLDRVADDVAGLLDRLRLDRVVLGGLSMGGYATMAFLRRHPERVRALVLADTKAAADPPDGAANRARIAGRLDADGSTAVLLSDVLPTLLGETTVRERPQVVAQVREMVESTAPAAAAWAQRAMAARPDSLDTLREADVPALVLRGAEDGLSSAADVAAMVAALPRGRSVELPGAGHLSAVEVPEAFGTVLAEFLDPMG